MAVSVTRLPGEPIVVATLCGPLNVDALRTMFTQTAELTHDLDGPIYRIADFLHADASFKSMARVVTETTRQRPYGTRDPRIRPVLVCGYNRLRFLPDLFRQKAFGGIDMPVFDTVDEALVHVRTQLEAELRPVRV